MFLERKLFLLHEHHKLDLRDVLPFCKSFAGAAVARDVLYGKENFTELANY